MCEVHLSWKFSFINLAVTEAQEDIVLVTSFQISLVLKNIPH